MKKIEHFSIPQILKKRFQISHKNRPSKRQIEQQKKSKTQKFQDEKQLNYDQILFQIVDKVKEKGEQSLNNQQKNKLIDLICKKTNLHLNKQKILSKMTVKQVDNICIIQKSYPQSSTKDRQFSSILKGKEDNANNFNKSKSNYFLLSGQMKILSANALDKLKLVNEDNLFDQRRKYKAQQYDQQQQSKQTIFFNKKQLYDQYPDYFQFQTINQLTGYGNLFNNQKNIQKEKQIQRQTVKNNQTTFSTMQPLSVQLNKKSNSLKPLKYLTNLPKLLVCEKAIYIQIKGSEDDQQYINFSGLSFEVIEEIVEKYKIFDSLGKKIKNYIQFFQLKEFNRNQKIYQTHQKADKFYLLIKGQIVFESQQKKQQPQRYKRIVKNVSPQRSHSNSIFQSKYSFKTQTISAWSYFGQQQLVFQLDQRSISAICKSSYCQVLFIGKQYFQKMLQYSDFAEVIRKGAKLKLQQRQHKINKSNSIRNKFTITQYNQDQVNQFQIPIVSQRQTVNLFRSKRGSVDAKYKVMHGNIIKTFTKQKNDQINEDIQFSMLAANPDMYESTLKKFRKYRLKFSQKKKSELNWNLQRNVLREDAEVTSPQGRKYYDSHKRYVNQISESKSLRPKASSTTYRTKLQYIAYLQQFKN